MDLLKRELEKKKKAIALAKEKAAAESTNRNGATRIFLKAGDLRRLQEEQEEELANKKRKIFETRQQQNEGEQSKKLREEAVSIVVPLLKLSEKHNMLDVIVASKLTQKEVMQKLRSMGFPIRLFGESVEDRLNRLQHALKQQANAKAGQTEMDEFRLGKGHGIRNPFLEKDEKEEAPTAQQKQKPKDKEEEDDRADPHKRIYRYFKDLLNDWEADLSKRDDALKKSVSGRNETKTLKQCKDYIRPLFKLCKTRKLEESLMNHILNIVDFCCQGEFVKAHDAYLDVAIGRAAWPIGVTMVGIHARSGRAKIESSNVAHVMNSELQRKYLTSVKRLMTYAQKKSDVLPSKKVT
jgi:pre-mRNA-splicing factor 18